MLISKGSIVSHNSFRVGDMLVGVWDGDIAYEPGEQKHVIETCQAIWNYVRAKVGNPTFAGLVRFDLVPSFEGDVIGESLGNLNVRGIYEVNGHSPECASADVLAALYGLGPPRSVAIERLVKAIQDWNADPDAVVTFVAGDAEQASLKRAWASEYAKALTDAGLHLVVKTPEEIMNTGEFEGLLYRWGDARFNGESHFSSGFVRWLTERQQLHSRVFNSWLPHETDLSRKGLLIARNPEDPMGDFLGQSWMLRTDEDIDRTIAKIDDMSLHTKLVLKPDGGASGNGIVFGDRYSVEGWLERVRLAVASSADYLVVERRSLPHVSLPDGRSCAIDLSPAFWACDGSLRYLYTIVRIADWEQYARLNVINVAKGAGFARVFV